MAFRIAIVQPISHPPGEDERNVADAVRAIEHAAGASRDEAGSSAACAAKQGVLGPQWQRPELYDSFYPRSMPKATE